MNELRLPTRKTVIEDVRIHHVRHGNLLFPPDWMLKDREPVTEAWTIFVTYRIGLQPSKVHLDYVWTEADADSIRERYRIGGAIPEPDLTDHTNRIRILMEGGALLGVAAGDSESPLAYEVLGDAGIYQERFGELSQEVVEFLGPARVQELRDSYGERWHSAAAFEFCWLRLPHSSPAFIAASYQYHYYITEDDFSAGYHWRDWRLRHTRWKKKP